MGAYQLSLRCVRIVACVLASTLIALYSWHAAAAPRSSRQAYEMRKVRSSSVRLDVVSDNQTLIGVKLPAPWDTKIPGPMDADFSAAQDAAWEVIATTVGPFVSTSARKGALAPNSVEGFSSVPHIFRLHGFNPTAIPALRASPGVLFVSNDPGVVNVQASPPGKADLLHPAQLGLENPGNVPYTSIDGLPQLSRKDVDIDIFGAWDKTVGNSNVVVAIIDDGFDLSKPELAANVYTNPLEFPCNGVDDDRNGFIDDYQGYDADKRTGCFTQGAQNRNKPQVLHGTAMALAMASSPRTVTGTISGAAPGIRFLPIATGPLISRGLEHAYEYVLAMKRAGIPIRVVNVSLGAMQPLPWACSPTTKDGKALTTLGQLLTSGITMVAAAGNEGMNIDSSFVCPSSLAKTFDNIITVGAVDLSGRAPFFSNFGPTAVTISAPGTAIYTGYGYQTGTSVATALVSGTVALMYSANPSLTPADVKRTLIETAKMTELNLPTQSKGLVSAGKAVNAVAPRTGPAIRKPLL